MAWQSLMHTGTQSGAGEAHDRQGKVGSIQQ
jgi:hypothetical protein